jgi:hypothetical protein
MVDRSGGLQKTLFARTQMHHLIIESATVVAEDSLIRINAYLLTSSTPSAMQPRQYHYVGPADIKQRARRESHCIHVTGVADLIRWSEGFLPAGRGRGIVPATFIIDTAEQLWVADRRSEHVACADGLDVLAAGEMIFERSGDRIHADEVTNQSTGYCPEPSCWIVVSRVLDRLGLPHPPSFTPAFEFRRCDQCGTTNLIKNDVFECAVCGSSLSPDWNYSNA